MCDPLTIGSLILTGASVAANSYAQSQVMSARNDALAAERIRQANYDKQAEALNTHSQDQYKDFSGKQDTRGAELGAQYTANQTPDAAPTDLMPQSASNVVVAEDAKQAGAAKDYSNQQGKALGNLRAFGDLLGEDSRLQARDAQGVAQIGDFKRGSANVLQLELQDANNAGAGASMFGDILGGLGGLAGKAGASGASLGSLFGGGAATGVVSSAPSFASARYPTTTVLGTGALRGTGSLY